MFFRWKFIQSEWILSFLSTVQIKLNFRRYQQLKVVEFCKEQGIHVQVIRFFINFPLISEFVQACFHICSVFVSYLFRLTVALAKMLRGLCSTPLWLPRWSHIPEYKLVFMFEPMFHSMFVHTIDPKFHCNGYSLCCPQPIHTNTTTRATYCQVHEQHLIH